MGIRGEPSTPDDPSQGLVWSAIVAQIDQPGSQSEFVSVGDSPRELFHKHPWSIGGGGAAELKEQLDDMRAARATCAISSNRSASSRTTHADEAFVAARIDVRIDVGLSMRSAIRSRATTFVIGRC